MQLHQCSRRFGPCSHTGSNLQDTYLAGWISQSEFAFLSTSRRPNEESMQETWAGIQHSEKIILCWSWMDWQHLHPALSNILWSVTYSSASSCEGQKYVNSSKFSFEEKNSLAFSSVDRNPGAVPLIPTCNNIASTRSLSFFFIVPFFAASMIGSASFTWRLISSVSHSTPLKRQLSTHSGKQSSSEAFNLIKVSKHAASFSTAAREKKLSPQDGSSLEYPAWYASCSW